MMNIELVPCHITVDMISHLISVSAVYLIYSHITKYYFHTGTLEMTGAEAPAQTFAVTWG